MAKRAAASLAAVPEGDDPLEGLKGLAQGFRKFAVANPVLAEIMFSRPFADFDPTTADDKEGVRVRKIFVGRVKAASDARLIAGRPDDIALVFFSLVEGLAAAENAGRLGSSKRSVERRWSLAVDALVAGLRP